MRGAASICVVVLAVLACDQDGAGMQDGGFGQEVEGSRGVFTMRLHALDAPHQGTNTFTLEVHPRGQDTPVTGAAVSVDAVMPAHGHGSGTPVSVTALDGGRYLLENVSFTMAGSWDLSCTVTRTPQQDVGTFHMQVP